jgi:hypothetical protein
MVYLDFSEAFVTLYGSDDLTDLGPECRSELYQNGKDD